MFEGGSLGEYRTKWRSTSILSTILFSPQNNCRMLAPTILTIIVMFLELFERHKSLRHLLERDHHARWTSLSRHVLGVYAPARPDHSLHSSSSSFALSAPSSSVFIMSAILWFLKRRSIFARPLRSRSSRRSSMHRSKCASIALRMRDCVMFGLSESSSYTLVPNPDTNFLARESLRFTGAGSGLYRRT